MARKRLTLNEKSKGLWHNIHAKRKRGEKMNPKGHPDAPTSKEMKMAQEAIQRRMDRMVIIATDPATGRKVVKIAPKKEILIGKGKQESVQVDELAGLGRFAIKQLAKRPIKTGIGAGLGLSLGKADFGKEIKPLLYTGAAVAGARALAKRKDAKAREAEARAKEAKAKAEAQKAKYNKEEVEQIDEIAPLIVGAIRAGSMAGKAYKAYKRAKGVSHKAKVGAGAKVLKRAYRQGSDAAKGKLGRVGKDYADSQLLKAPLIPAKVASAAVDKAWKMAGKTPRTSNIRAADVKKQAYQHDPGGQRIKNLVAKPAAVSVAYGAKPTYLHKQAYNVAMGKKIENPYKAKEPTTRQQKKSAYTTTVKRKDG